MTHFISYIDGKYWSHFLSGNEKKIAFGHKQLQMKNRIRISMKNKLELGIDKIDFFNY